MTDKMQIVTITLSDGRVGTFSGKVLCTLDDEAAKVHVSKIQFHEPQPMPDGAKWESVNQFCRCPGIPQTAADGTCFYCKGTVK